MNYHSDCKGDVDGLERLYAGDIDDLDDFDEYGHRIQVRPKLFVRSKLLQ